MLSHFAQGSLLVGLPTSYFLQKKERTCGRQASFPSGVFLLFHFPLSFCGKMRKKTPMERLPAAQILFLFQLKTQPIRWDRAIFRTSHQVVVFNRNESRIWPGSFFSMSDLFHCKSNLIRHGKEWPPQQTFIFFSYGHFLLHFN